MYKRTKSISAPTRTGYVNVKCLIEVNIYQSGGKTYLDISMPYKEDSMIFKLFNSKWIREIIEQGKITELNGIIDQIKFLKPSIMGYLVCNKCGAYYEVSNENPLQIFQINVNVVELLNTLKAQNSLKKKLWKEQKNQIPQSIYALPQL